MKNKTDNNVFTDNLNKYVKFSGKTQLEISKAIGVSPQTFNSWTRGNAIPRMDKMQLLADYFNIAKSDLIEDTVTCCSSSSDSDTASRLNGFLRANPDYTSLFDSVMSVKREDIPLVQEVLTRLTKNI
jgi:transcriptional regulator with XRE-family HTH domain